LTNGGENVFLLSMFYKGSPICGSGDFPTEPDEGAGERVLVSAV